MTCDSRRPSRSRITAAIRTALAWLSLVAPPPLRFVRLATFQACNRVCGDAPPPPGSTLTSFPRLLWGDIWCTVCSLVGGEAGPLWRACLLPRPVVRYRFVSFTLDGLRPSWQSPGQQLSAPIWGNLIGDKSLQCIIFRVTVTAPPPRKIEVKRPASPGGSVESESRIRGLWLEQTWSETSWHVASHMVYLLNHHITRLTV